MYKPDVPIYIRALKCFVSDLVWLDTVATPIGSIMANITMSPNGRKRSFGSSSQV